MSRPALELCGVGKRYRRGGARSLHSRFVGNAPPAHWVQVLRDVDLTVHPGDVVGVVGSNGEGKSTLLRVAAGLTKPSSGTVHRSVATAGLFSLNASANGDLSGADNAVTAAVLAGLSPEQARGRLRQIADFAELGEDILREPLRTYSDGMKLRLAFAAAATMEPELLLIDEVLAVGDIGFQEKCLSYLEQLRDRGCALVVASHVMHHLHRLATEVVWLRGGQVYAAGRASELLDAYERWQDDKGGPPEPLADGGYRRGNGQVVLSETSCLSAKDAPRGTTRLGAGLTVRLDYRRDAAVRFAHFSVSLRRVGSDLRLVDVTTAASGGGTVLLRDRGTVTLTLDRLDLEPGDYWVDTGVYSEDWETVYDYRWDSVRLAVLGPSTSGCLQPPHRWATT